MAKSINGFFGKVTGKVGAVIFSSWKGIPYMRSHQKPYRSNTPAQQLQRKKFKLVRRFINIVKPVINAGFKWDLVGKTELNSAMSYIMKWAMKGGLEDLAIHYPAVLVAKGDLPPATGGQVAVTGEGNLYFSWENTGDMSSDRASDKALILAYCPETEQAFWSVDEGVLRGDEGYTLSLPAGLGGRSLETYLAFTTANGQEASNSVWLGRVEV